MSIKELSKNISGIDWLFYLKSTVNKNITENDMVVVYSLSYFQKLELLLKQTEQKVIYNYAIFQIIDNILQMLPGPYVTVRSVFEKAHSGASRPDSRNSLCLLATKRRFDGAMSSEYIKLYFNQKSKDIVSRDKLLSIKN